MAWAATEQCHLFQLDDACLLAVCSHLSPLPDLFSVTQTCTRLKMLVANHRMCLTVTASSSSAAASARSVRSAVALTHFNTLQAAVSASAPGDTIVLSPGVHAIAESVVIAHPLRLLGAGGWGEGGSMLVSAKGVDATLHVRATCKLTQLGIHSTLSPCVTHSGGRLHIECCSLTCDAAGLDFLCSPLVTRAATTPPLLLPLSLSPVRPTHSTELGHSARPPLSPPTSPSTPADVMGTGASQTPPLAHNTPTGTACMDDGLLVFTAPAACAFNSVHAHGQTPARASTWSQDNLTAAVVTHHSRPPSTAAMAVELPALQLQLLPPQLVSAARSPTPASLAAAAILPQHAAQCLSSISPQQPTCRGAAPGRLNVVESRLQGGATAISCQGTGVLQSVRVIYGQVPLFWLHVDSAVPGVLATQHPSALDVVAKTRVSLKRILEWEEEEARGAAGRRSCGGGHDCSELHMVDALQPGTGGVQLFERFQDATVTGGAWEACRGQRRRAVQEQCLTGAGGGGLTVLARGRQDSRQNSRPGAVADGSCRIVSADAAVVASNAVSQRPVVDNGLFRISQAFSCFEPDSIAAFMRGANGQCQ